MLLSTITDSNNTNYAINPLNDLMIFDTLIDFNSSIVVECTVTSFGQGFLVMVLDIFSGQNNFLYLTPSNYTDYDGAFTYTIRKELVINHPADTLGSLIMCRFDSVGYEFTLAKYIFLDIFGKILFAIHRIINDYKYNPFATDCMINFMP